MLFDHRSIVSVLRFHNPGVSSAGHPKLSPATLRLTWVKVLVALTFPVPLQPMPQKRTILLVPFCKVSKRIKIQFFSFFLLRFTGGKAGPTIFLSGKNKSLCSLAFRCMAPPDTSFISGVKALTTCLHYWKTEHFDAYLMNPHRSFSLLLHKLIKQSRHETLQKYALNKHVQLAQNKLWTWWQMLKDLWPEASAEEILSNALCYFPLNKTWY